jgi:hypothetical protein
VIKGGKTLHESIVKTAIYVGKSLHEMDVRKIFDCFDGIVI